MKLIVSFLMIAMLLPGRLPAHDNTTLPAAPRESTAKRGERLLVYDCDVLGDTARQELEKRFTVEVVSVTALKDGKPDPLGAIRDDLSTRRDPPRLVLFACHGNVKAGKLSFSPETEGGKPTFRLPAEDLLDTLEGPMSKLNNPVLFLMTCHAGAIKDRAEKQSGAVCAACGADECANATMFAHQLNRAFDKCDELDTDGDGKVTTSELRKWFSAKDAVERDVEGFLTDFQPAAETKMLDRLRAQIKKGTQDAERIADRVSRLDGSHADGPYRDVIPKKIKVSVEAAKKSKENNSWENAFEEALAVSLDWVGAIEPLKKLDLVNGAQWARLHAGLKAYYDSLKGDGKQDPDELWSKYVSLVAAEFAALEKAIQRLPDDSPGRSEGLQALRAGRMWVDALGAERERNLAEKALEDFRLLKTLAAMQGMKRPAIFDGKRATDKSADSVVAYCPATPKPVAGR